MERSAKLPDLDSPLALPLVCAEQSMNPLISIRPNTQATAAVVIQVLLGLNIAPIITEPSGSVLISVSLCNLRVLCASVVNNR